MLDRHGRVVAAVVGVGAWRAADEILGCGWVCGDDRGDEGLRVSVDEEEGDGRGLRQSRGSKERRESDGSEHVVGVLTCDLRVRHGFVML